MNDISLWSISFFKILERDNDDLKHPTLLTWKKKSNYRRNWEFKWSKFGPTSLIKLNQQEPGEKGTRTGDQEYRTTRLFQGQLPSAKEDLADTTVAHGVRIDPTNTLMWWHHSPCSIQPQKQARPCEQFPLLHKPDPVNNSHFCALQTLVFKAQRGTKGLLHMQTGEAGKAKTWPVFFSCLWRTLQGQLAQSA